MPAQPNANAGQTNANGTRTRSNREGPSAPQKLMAEFADALNAGVRVYGADAEKLTAYVNRVTAFIKTASLVDSGKMAATSEVIITMLSLEVPPADATPVPAPAPAPAPAS